jgi:hypothetical protein
MSKQGVNPSGRSRVRVLYLEGDLASGDLEQLTATLAGAVRPAIIAKPSLVAGAASAKSRTNGHDAESDQIEFEELEPEVADDADLVVERASAKPRKYPSPKIVADLDVIGNGNSFADFATLLGNPEEIQTRYLIAAYWLTEYAKVEPVTYDHVYTCYRAADWVFEISDPTFPFRNLKKRGWGEVKSGQLTLNQIGKAQVEKMIKSAAK